MEFSTSISEEYVKALKKEKGNKCNFIQNYIINIKDKKNTNYFKKTMETYKFKKDEFGNEFINYKDESMNHENLGTIEERYIRYLKEAQKMDWQVDSFKEWFRRISNNSLGECEVIR